MKYKDYLKSPEWMDLRNAAYKRANNKCEFCGNPAVAVHHVKYPKNYSQDTLENLVAVCKSCHDKSHGIRTDERLYMFWEVIKILTEESNHELDACFETVSINEYAEDGKRMYRHKGYLYDETGLFVLSWDKGEATVCFDWADEKMFKRIY